MHEYIEKVKKAFSSNNKISLLLIIGIVGIALLGSQSIFTNNSKNKKTEITVDVNKEYLQSIEKSVKEIVSAISGDDSPSVIVTLDTGVKYIYADETETDSQDNEDVSKDTTKTQVKGSTHNNTVIVEDSSGAQTALKVTERMPTVRGVSVICANGSNISVCNRIINSITTALDISEKKVFVTGK